MHAFRSIVRPRVFGMCLLAFGAGFGLASAAEQREPLRIVFIAYQNPEQLIEDIDPVIAYLTERLGRPVKDFVATDYMGVVEALRNGGADVGFMGPLQYVMARREAGAYPILGEIYGGKSTYVSRIFVRRDSGISSPAQLKGRTIAFVDPISSSGYLYPLDIFYRDDLISGDPESYFRRMFFAGGDEQAIRAVYNGFVDAAGIGQFSFNLLRAEERDEVVAIAESRTIPSHCVVVRKGLQPEIARAVQAALLDLNNEGPHHKLLQNLYGVDGYVKVTHEDYLAVEELARQRGFIK